MNRYFLKGCIIDDSIKHLLYTGYIVDAGIDTNMYERAVFSFEELTD